MTRAAVAALVCAAALLAPGAASAHPLGNFSINHLAEVSVSADRVDVRYVLDVAEIPTFQQRDLSEGEVTGRALDEVRADLAVTVDGRRAELRPSAPPALARPLGAGGLRTTRIELRLSAPADSPRAVDVRDRTYAGRVGWRAIVARPGRGTDVRANVPARDPTGGLRRYPAGAPADIRAAHLDVRPGAGIISGAGGATAARTGVDAPAGADDPLSRAFADAAAGKGVIVLLLLTAFAWGALHALSPGHGKAMVAAYLVGTRGTPRHAVILGATVTATHTAGVFALGFVALALTDVILPEDLYPWLSLASGLLIVAVGTAVLRRNTKGSGPLAPGGLTPHHHHAPSRRGLLAMGAAAGLIPCPSALVVLLGAVAQGEVGLGMLLIVAFSAGLAATLTGLGLAVVVARRALGLVRVPARLATAVTTGSALAIVGVGCVLTAQALPQLA
jgi:ABC-type nickel/cobalt efflux system permease component RcnA